MASAHYRGPATVIGPDGEEYGVNAILTAHWPSTVGDEVLGVWSWRGTLEGWCRSFASDTCTLRIGDREGEFVIVERAAALDESVFMIEGLGRPPFD